ncbi:hypothetical protein FN846DRAFT_894939 [Sphaerosporella brunnea]|uniref:Uncharacterized protein n=1 Tax=Sphaerosporella brunnea TaxID=1250544 RepID=A0A5J5EIT5_9PEZI|nr:hypothetical protein FN846DRAFT_894939 [Sphaerosporella brunnea]
MCGKLSRYLDISLPATLDILYARNFDVLVINVAQKAHSPESKLRGIYRRYADYLYGKENLMARCSGISKPLRIHNHIEYLEELHMHDAATLGYFSKRPLEDRTMIIHEEYTIDAGMPPMYIMANHRRPNSVCQLIDVISPVHRGHALPSRLHLEHQFGGDDCAFKPISPASFFRSASYSSSDIHSSWGYSLVASHAEGSQTVLCVWGKLLP